MRLLLLLSLTICAVLMCSGEAKCQGEAPLAGPLSSATGDREILVRHGKRDAGVHDPSSIVRCGGTYWLFATGRGVASWRSEDLVTWQRGPAVFRQPPAWVTQVVADQRGHLWAPDIICWGDRYLLYYSVSSFGKNSSAIALASNTTLDPEDPAYHWVDEGIVIQTTAADNYNAIDPAIIATSGGELWMSFGSFWSGLKLLQLDPKTGKRAEPQSDLHSVAQHREIEAPHLHERDGWFYLLFNHGICCRGVDSTYEIRVGRSRTITGPYLDRQGQDLLNGGGDLLLQTEGPFIGPGHPNVRRDGDRDWLHCHYYDATESGRSKLAITELNWDAAGWPVVIPYAVQIDARANIYPTVGQDLNSAPVQNKLAEATVAAIPAAPAAAIANARPEIPTDWIDPATGHRVVRLSQQTGSASLYFHQNAFSPTGDELLISTPRGLEMAHLQTRELRVIVPAQDYRLGGSSGVEVGRQSRHVYYTTRHRFGSVLKATHLDTLETRELASLPFGAALNGVNADETLAFGTINESVSREQRSQTDRRMKFFTARIDTGEVTTFHPSTDWLNHGQCSPTDPQLALFCHEGPWHDVDRIWTIRLGATAAKLLHRRQQPFEIAGHEFFSADGQWVWYDLQTPRSAEFWLAGVQLTSGERVRYRVDRDQWSVHYNVSRDGLLFAGDGGGPNSVANQTPLPDKKRLNPPGNGQWIYLFRPDAALVPDTVSGEPARSGRLNAERLVDLSRHDYSLEPNVVFSPDGNWIIFRSNMHGERHVYMVRITKE